MSRAAGLVTSRAGGGRIGWRFGSALVALAVLAGCATAGPAPQSAPANPPRPRAVILVSARAEWQALLPLLRGAPVHDTPFGDWVAQRLGGVEVVLFHGGYGKVSAAGSTQYAIDRWHPSLLVNLGTAGGFGEGIAVGDVVLATRTVIYDIVERMGDPDEAIADFATGLDVSAWPARLRGRVKAAPLVSADRDLDPADLPALRRKYQAPAGDWESGAIAFVAARNRTPVVILRAVSDVVGATGSAAYGDAAAWERATAGLMSGLLALTADALPDLLAATARAGAR